MAGLHEHDHESCFNFKESAVNETQVRQLHTGDYLKSARNLVFVGSTGTGKTHQATALAREVVLQGKRARFYSVVACLLLEAMKHCGPVLATPLYYCAP